MRELCRLPKIVEHENRSPVLTSMEKLLALTPSTSTDGQNSIPVGRSDRSHQRQLPSITRVIHDLRRT